MEKLTRKEVEEACAELAGALVQTIELDEKLQNIKLLQAKAQKRLSIARDEVRALKI